MSCYGVHWLKAAIGNITCMHSSVLTTWNNLFCGNKSWNAGKMTVGLCLLLLSCVPRPLMIKDLNSKRLKKKKKKSIFVLVSLIQNLAAHKGGGRTFPWLWGTTWAALTISAHSLKFVCTGQRCRKCTCPISSYSSWHVLHLPHVFWILSVVLLLLLLLATSLLQLAGEHQASGSDGSR